MDEPGHHALYLLFTPTLCAADPWHTLEAALRGGVDLVQWRCKHDDPDGALRCLSLCARFDVPVIVDDDVDLAVRIGARGAHVGQHDLPPEVARRRLHPDQWLGVSTHDRSEIARAISGGADHLGFGPIFPTATKGYATGQPDGALADALAATTLPIFAIGGITPANVERVVAEGCRRIAVSSALLVAADPAAVAATLRRSLER